MKNLIIEKSLKYDIKKKKGINESFTYNSILGFWVSQNNLPLLFDKNMQKPMTKKHDIETGEDHKGE